ncbi:MAG: hypothetical protein PHE83_13775 [Opitutaceae bacterium]|nr:hypothetical protein [Opitutaceae bacterium]
MFTKGLQACVTNNLEACLGIWYAGYPKLAAEMNAKVSAATKNLGNVIDTEVVATQTISKRVTRYYAAIYFARRPLWIRIERYTSGEGSFYLPLKYSFEPDEILPGYLTDFVQ